MNRICNTCSIEIDENNYLKKRAVCKSYNKNGRKNNHYTSIQNQQPKNDNNHITNNASVSAYEHHAYVVIGPRNVGKTYYMLKIIEKAGNKRPIHIITRSPSQYPNYKTNNEIKPINKYKRSVVIIDDMLGARNSSQKDEFYTRGRHEKVDVYYISQSYFGFEIIVIE